MATVVRSIDELSAAIQPVLIGMVDELAQQVYVALNYFLKKYYDSYEPQYYRRQYDFLYSAIKVKGKIVRGKVVAVVYIDTDSMNNYYQASGKQVATWANEGLHGGKNLGTNTPHVWDETMANTVDNEALVRDAVAYLRSQGFTVRV